MSRDRCRMAQTLSADSTRKEKARIYSVLSRALQRILQMGYAAKSRTVVNGLGATTRLLNVSTEDHEMSHIQRNSLLKTILAQFECHPHGVHGVAHWARVRVHAIEIGRMNGADLRVVELFAFLHDSRRENEYRDYDHGRRAADYAKTLRGELFSLEDAAFLKLQEALEGHSNGGVHFDDTIQTCWDADRLDLVRLKIDPNPDFLSEIAEARIERAWEMIAPRSRRSRVDA